MAQRVQRQPDVPFLRHPVDQRGADPRLMVIGRWGATHHAVPVKALEKAIARRFSVALRTAERNTPRSNSPAPANGSRRRPLTPHPAPAPIGRCARRYPVCRCAIGFQRQPERQGAKAPRIFRRQMQIVVRPRRRRFRVGRMVLKYLHLQIQMAGKLDRAVIRHVQPFVRIDGDGVRLLPACKSRCIQRRTGRHAPKAASTCSQNG